METGKSHFVIGLGHGDEAKAKVVDMVGEAMPEDTMIVRYNGGANAGHTIRLPDGRKFVTHGLPSGVAHKDKTMYIASGCVVNMPSLTGEMKDAADMGYPVDGRLRVSSQASIVQPHHRLLDLATMYNIGTTGQGIGPAYGDKAYRMEGERQLNIQLGDLLDHPEHFFKMMEKNLRVARDRVVSGVYGTPEELLTKLFGPDSPRIFDPAAAVAEQRAAFEKIRPLIERDPQYVIKHLRRGYHALFEGAQAFGIEMHHGANPFVTPSRVSPAAAFDSANVPLGSPIGDVIGVYKATPSRVGWGPFPSEFGGADSEEYCMKDGGKAHTKEYELAAYGSQLDAMIASGDPLQIGKAARIKWDEYGATSKRPRRVGATDLPWVRNAVNILGINRVVLSAVDRLGLFAGARDRAIPYVSGYRADGRAIDFVPNTNLALKGVTADIALSPAFAEDITGVRHASQLPEGVHRFVRRVEEGIDARVSEIGVGPSRDQMVTLGV